MTTKKDSFERFTADRITFFENWKEASLDKKERKDLARIKVAFTAIAFEHWLLLHYEYSTAAFYNSREYYPYFDSNNYLTYRKLGQTKYFDKGYLLYKERAQFKAFFEQVETKAVPNALFLQNSYVALLLGRGLSHYEINPYCDLYHLIGSLINTNFLEIGTVCQIKTADDLNKNLLKDLSLNRNESRLQLSFQLVYQQPLLCREIEAALSFIVYAQNGEIRESSPQNIEFSGANIYRKGEQVEVEFDLAPFQQGESCCLYIDLKVLYPNKGKQLCYSFIA